MFALFIYFILFCFYFGGRGEVNREFEPYVHYIETKQIECRHNTHLIFSFQIHISFDLDENRDKTFQASKGKSYSMGDNKPCIKFSSTEAA